MLRLQFLALLFKTLTIENVSYEAKSDYEFNQRCQSHFQKYSLAFDLFLIDISPRLDSFESKNFLPAAKRQGQAEL